MNKVLILEDEEAIRSFIVVNLRRNGYDVVEAGDGDEALRILRADPGIDVALLDVMVPGIDGFEVCRQIREDNERIGIIFLTAKVQERDKVLGLSLGADDHIGKPFSPNELMARIHSLMRRVQLTKRQGVEKHVSGPFVLNMTTRELLKHDQRIEVTPTEFALLCMLMDNRDLPLSRNQLLDHVWGENYVGDPKIVDVNIRRLRQKIEDDPSQPAFIEAIWGFGYKWRAECE